MNRIYKYKIVRDDYTTYRISSEGITELCTIAGETYIHGPEVLPALDHLNVEVVELNDDLRAAIKTASPQCQLIYTRMEAQIRERYATDDEIFLTRIGVGQALGVYQMSAGEQAEILAYQTFVEEVRRWGREQRAELGL